jgi:choline dehydrogenase-like flavoprotein
VQYDPEHWVKAIGRPDVRRFPLWGGRIMDMISQFSPPTRMGIDYLRELKSARRLRVYLYANVTEIETDSEASTVTSLRVQTLTGRVVTAKAKAFILAAGGIENARLLLASNRRAPAGLGNAHDLVGRYFMEHPRVTTGWIELAPAWRNNKLYDHRYHYHNPEVSANGICVAAQFTPVPEVQREEELLHSSVWLYSELPGERTAVGEALIRSKRRLMKQEQPGRTQLQDVLTVSGHPLQTLRFVVAYYWPRPERMRGVRMKTIVEPTPDPDSRVTLSTAKDRLGMPRVRVDWRLDDRVRRTFDRTAALLAEEMERTGVARVQLDPPILGGEWPATFEREGSWHHMGTTRMHKSPRQGVVDPNCLVHGMTNLYVAGSSVFPTGGANFPTLTLVALAIRLADHVFDRMTTSYRVREPETARSRADLA